MRSECDFTVQLAAELRISQSADPRYPFPLAGMATALSRRDEPGLFVLDHSRFKQLATHNSRLTSATRTPIPSKSVANLAAKRTSGESQGRRALRSSMTGLLLSKCAGGIAIAW